DADATYIEVSVALAAAVRETRRARRMSRADLARRIGATSSAIAKIEAGDPSAKLDSLIRALFALGITSRQLGRLVADAGVARTGTRRARLASARRRRPS